MYDVIVIGAGPAGAPAAMLLARRGLRTLLLEQKRIPADQDSAHLIQLPGIERLARWGLLDRLAVSGCPPIGRLTLDLGEAVITGTPPARGGVRTLYAPARADLDRLLVTAAVEAGVELREECAAEELLWRDGAIAGVRAQGRDGRAVIERARIVVGADGVDSLVAASVAAPFTHVRPPQTFVYGATYRDVSVRDLQITMRDGWSVVAFPVGDNHTRVQVQGRQEAHAAFAADVEASFARALGHAPALAERVQAAHRTSPLFGSAGVPSFFRQAYGPGWALVGDAGQHTDLTLAHGVASCFRDAELLVEGLAEALDGRRPMAEALAEYQGRRDAAALPLFGLITRMAALAPPAPVAAQLMRAIAADPVSADGFMGVLCGVTPEAAFFAPEQSARLHGQTPVAA